MGENNGGKDMSKYKLVPAGPTQDWVANLEKIRIGRIESVIEDVLASAPAINIVATKNEQGQIVSVTLQDEDHRVLEVIAEADVQGEPVGWVNSDELDNMLDDRTATLFPVRTGFHGRPVYAAPQPAEQQLTCAYVCTVPDDCETLHWRGQILSMNELASVAQPAAGEEIMVNAAHDVYTLPLQPSGLLSGPRFVVHVPGPEQLSAVDGAKRGIASVRFGAKNRDREAASRISGDGAGLSRM